MNMRSDILYEIDVLLHLKQQDIVVSVPVPKKDGDFLYDILAPEDPRTFVLFTYAPGSPHVYKTNVENESYIYGRSVAQIHLATEYFSSQHKRFPLDLNHLVNEPLNP